MKSRWALRFVLFVGAAMAAVALVLRTSWAGAQVCATAQGVLGRVLGERVTIDRCAIEPLASSIVVEGIRIGDPARPRFSAHRLLVDLAPLAFGRRFALDAIELDRPVVDLVVGPGGGDPESEGDGDCLGFLRGVEVDALRIRDGSAIVRLPDGTEARVGAVDLEVDLRRRAYEARLEVRDAALASTDLEVPIQAIDAFVRLAADGERLDVDRLRIAGAGVEAHVHGSLADLCDPDVALQATVGAALAPLAGRFAPALEDVRGAASMQASVRGPVGAPEAQAAIELRGVAFGDFDIGDVDLRAAFAGRTLTLDELIWPVGEGRAVVRGELELAGDLPARASVVTEKLRFEQLLARLPVKNTPVQMTIDSEHQLAGRLGGAGLLLEGDSRLRIGGFHVDDAPWHDPAGERIVEIAGPATLDARVRLTADGIVVDPARAGFGPAPGSQLQIAARLGFTEAAGMTIRVRAPHFDIGHLRGHVAGIPLAGAGEIVATIEGPYADPVIEGDVDLQDGGLWSARLGHVRSHVRALPSTGHLEFVGAVGQEGATTWEADVVLGLGGDPTLDASARLRPGGRLGDLFGATASLAEPLAWLRDNLDGRIVSARATAKGRLPDVEAEGIFVASDARFLDRPFDTLEAEIRVPGIERLVIDRVEFGRADGRAKGSGTIAFPRGATATVDAEVEAHRLPLRDLLGGFGTWADLRGDVGARGYLRGPIDRLDVGGELYAEEVSASGVKLRATRLSLETQGDQVIVRGPVAGAGTVSGAVRLAAGLPFEATLRLDVPRLSRFLPDDLRIRGAITGTATAIGTLADVTASRGSVELDRLALRLADYRLESEDRIRLTFDGGAFDLPDLRLRGENTELRLAGSRSAAGALDLRAQGRFDARILDSLLPQIEHTTGVVDIKAALTGTGERPVLVGSANVERGAFRVKALPIQVQRLSSKLTFSQNQVLVEEGTMQVNQGRARLRGSVSLRSWAPDRLDLTLDGERVSWRMPADWPAVVSGRLHLGGAWPRDLLLSGELVVDRLRYARDLDLEKMLLDFRQRVRQPPRPDEEEWLRLDVHLIGGEDMRVDNNLLRARLQFVAPPGTRRGRLELVGTNVRIGLLGAVEVLDGIAYFRGNEYRVTHGVVEFDDRTAIDPHFDFTADTSIREYRVVARAWGRLGDEGMEGFQLELASEPTLAQADILTLLTFGITSRDLERGGSAFTGAGVAAEALLTASGLDEHVKRWLPDTELILDPEFSVTSQYVEMTGQVEPMATFEAKVISDRLRLQAAAPFSTARGRRVATEYRLNERLSGQMVWEDEETGYSLGDLGVDIKLRWEWE